MAGQNERAFPAVFQVVEGKFELVYPKTVQTASPILPLPASSPFALDRAEGGFATCARATPPRSPADGARLGLPPPRTGQRGQSPRSKVIE